MAGIGSLVCGLELSCVPDLNKSVSEAAKDGFSFVLVPLVHPRYDRDNGETGQGRAIPFTRSDALIGVNSEWSQRILCRMTPWLDVDSPDPLVRKESSAAFLQEVSWASHVGVTAMMLPTPLRRDSFGNFASLTRKALTILTNSQLWVRIPMGYPDGQGDPWELWNSLRTLCEHHSNLHVALEMSGDLPDPAPLRRWLGEPLKACILPSHIYLTNNKGFPVLSKAHQEFVKTLLRRGPMHFVLSGRLEGSVYTPATFPRYLAHLREQVKPLSPAEQSVLGYEDALQAPLQPLMDNLDSGTYQVFERDTIKYDKYEEAMRRALLDLPENSATGASPYVIMVVGAGRGPLVRRALQAANTTKRTVRVYALDKNPYAIVNLLAQKEEVWRDSVTVVSADMRSWQAPEQADIIVSELLGSFGDNELSPECVDGSQRFLKPNGVNIPQRYTSYLAPLSSSTLFNAIKNIPDCRQIHFEQPYVTLLHNVCTLAEPKPAIVFEHPNFDDPVDNSRYVSVSFQAEQSGTVHGFAGYFDSHLYKDVLISTVPSTHSFEMYSWFPIFFPLRNPMYVAKGSRIEILLWRVASSTHVWYEWAVVSPVTSPIHNPGGRSYKIGL